MNIPADASGRRARLVFVGLGCLALLGLGSVVWQLTRAPSSPPRIQDAQAALGAGDYARAEQIASRIGRDDAAWPDAQLVAGEAATKAGRLETASRYYASVPRDGSETSVAAAFAFAEVCRHVGRLSEAEEAYRYTLKHAPKDAAAHYRMAFVLGVTGRRWESRPHYMALVRAGHMDLDSLSLLGDLERPMEQGAYLRQCAEKHGDDVLVQLGLGAHAVAEGNASDARRRLRAVVEKAPHLVAAQAMLGELLVDAKEDVFLQWHADLPDAADENPDIWFVRGLWARRQGDLRVAARCFWETVRLAPTHRRGTYQLGQVLISLKQTSGEEFAERSDQLYKLTQTLDDVLRSRGRYEAAVRRVCELLEQMGRIWEASAWAGLATQLFPQSGWPRATLARLAGRLDEETPRTIASANLALQHDLSGLPGHEQLFAQRRREEPHHRAGETASIRFDKETGPGIDFVYVNGSDASTPGARMFEQTGGGVAVLDYDRDGWPDLYFTQGTEWPHGATAPDVSSELTNCMYRNVGGRSVVGVTAETGLGDPGFGQGCAVGDFNNDGFPDLYVANVGGNRLYHNNGDGTFSDVTDDCGLAGEEWTASCLIADLNADGMPDLFDVNYVKGDNVYTAICDGLACSPNVFDGTPDRVLLSRGDGTFEFISDATPDSTNAKGLGVLAADVFERGRPCLFIANDQVPNFFLRNVPSENGRGVRFEEEAFVQGLAYNENGLPMACMGIAADDADGDGRLDFFVTNFADEANTLYLQDAPGLFVDATNVAGLRGPSWPYVGWGTQFLDADLDGNPDLVVANGHVDDFSHKGQEYHMRPQFFRNTGGARFVELTPEQVGDYFDRKFLGRGLARLDFNRDGLMDFAVSHIGEKAALVANRSTGTGHFLNVRLVATITARDAIGSVVEVVTDERRWTKQLVAGDGYMASNERMLQFGLGPAGSIKELRVRWPSGNTTTLRDVPVDVTVELVEGGGAVRQKATD